MDMSQYLEIFIEETREHLQSLNQCLLKMEKNPEDSSMLNEIFRVAHTLKGMSATMGFNRMARLTHDMEDVLHALRSNEIKVSPKLIDLLFKCLDALESYTAMVVDTGLEGIDENASIIKALSDILQGNGADDEITPDYVDTIEDLERITTSLHDAVMKVRMVPVETVFNRFPRMIRDIAKDLGKEVELIMSGEETELDRTVIDEIGDPLIHLLRNSADHGIESMEKRKSLGKNETGRIALRAYQDGNIVVIEVEDDGEGINIDKVKKKAIERGLINKDMATNLTKKDIIEQGSFPWTILQGLVRQMAESSLY